MRLAKVKVKERRHGLRGIIRTPFGLWFMVKYMHMNPSFPSLKSC